MCDICAEVGVGWLHDKLAEAQPWKDAVIDALVADFIYTAEHETDPRKAINDLMCWEQIIALDPMVSPGAQALIDRGRAEAQQQIAALTADKESFARILRTVQQSEEALTARVRDLEHRVAYYEQDPNAAEGYVPENAG